MKKILISQKDLHATRSGVPRIVHQQLRYFSSKGYMPYAAAERIDKEAVVASGGIPYKTFRWPISGFYRRKNYMNRVSKAVKKLVPELVIGHGDIVQQDICYIHNCVHLAYELINGKQIPKDHEVAKIHEEILNGQLFKALICNSRMMKNDLMERFNIPENKIDIIYPMYTSDKFYEGAGDRDKTRNDLGYNCSDLVLGFITSGNFKKRNLSLVIEACAKIDLPFKVLVAGKDKVEKYQQRIKELGMEDKFKFVPSINEVENYFAACDVFVLPAHIEEFGLSIMEAMACGKAVVTTDKTGASELFEGESQDYILKDKTVDELSQKLATLIEDKELRDRLGKLNAQTALKHSDKAKAEEFGLMLKKFGFDF